MVKRCKMRLWKTCKVWFVKILHAINTWIIWSVLVRSKCSSRSPWNSWFNKTMSRDIFEQKAKIIGWSWIAGKTLLCCAPILGTGTDVELSRCQKEGYFKALLVSQQCGHWKNMSDPNEWGNIIFGLIVALEVSLTLLRTSRCEDLKEDIFLQVYLHKSRSNQQFGSKNLKI